MDSIFDLSRCLSSTIGRAVNAESITIASSYYRDSADARSHNHRAQGDVEISFVVMACVFLMAHRQLDRLSLAGFAAE
jgi:hypothetical protein